MVFEEAVHQFRAGLSAKVPSGMLAKCLRGVLPEFEVNEQNYINRKSGRENKIGIAVVLRNKGDIIVLLVEKKSDTDPEHSGLVQLHR